MTRLRVVVDGRFRPAAVGGVGTVVEGLAQGMAGLALDDIDVTFITHAGASDWLRPYVGGHVLTHEVTPPGRWDGLRRRSRLWAIRPAAGSFGVRPARDHVLSGLGADVVHHPFQGRGWVPQTSIYHPHDLQHRHLPEFFTPRQRAWREVVYADNCRRATAVAVGTTWVRDDLIRQMGIDPAKIFVIPMAPIDAAAGRPDDDLAAYSLPPRFVTYPAASWLHKNHHGLFAAMAMLRGRGVSVPLVITGSREVGVDIAKTAADSGVADLVHDLGFVPQPHVELIVQRAVAMVVPSLFEAASFPVWEAMRLGTPVACSNVTSLPRQVGDAGLVFDPRSPDSIAECVLQLWSDAGLRATLSERAQLRVQSFTWERTARHFLALYRRLANRVPDDGDEALLTAEPML